MEPSPLRFLEKLDIALKAVDDRLLELRSRGDEHRRERLELGDVHRTILFLRKAQEQEAATSGRL